MGLPAGTGPRSLPKPSTSMYKNGVASALMCVGTNTSVSIMTPVVLMASLLESPNIPQSTMP